MAYVHIAHDDVVGSHCVMANRVSLAGEVEVGDWAVIGGHVAVHQWTRIGEHTMIQGGALVGKDIPLHHRQQRSGTFRLRQPRGIKSQGIYSGDDRADPRRLPHPLPERSELPERLRRGRKQIPQSPERDRLIRFIRESQRGIVKPYSPNSEKTNNFSVQRFENRKHSLHL